MSDKHIKLFLGGTIDNGKAKDWQKNVIELLSACDVHIYNPRKENWNPQASNEEKEIQIKWEIEHQEKADIIFYNFEPNAKSPVTLLELGLFASSRFIIVCCPPTYEYFCNVKFVCEMYQIPLLTNFQTAVGLIKNHLNLRCPVHI